MHKKPSHIKIVHGDEDAKAALANKYKAILNEQVLIEIGK